ncbi:MAG: hypothetical protein ACKPKO_32430 [Candidatus Fonsibacter sp.]
MVTDKNSAETVKNRPFAWTNAGRRKPTRPGMLTMDFFRRMMAMIWTDLQIQEMPVDSIQQAPWRLDIAVLINTNAVGEHGLILALDQQSPLTGRLLT